MRALRYSEYGPPNVLWVDDVDVPEPSDDQVQVAVKSVGINPLDFLVRQGHRKAIFPLTLPSGIGSDFSGVVSAIGAAGSGLRVGDTVFGCTTFRTLADYIVVDAAELTLKPSRLAWHVAACIGVSGLAAHAALASQAVTESDTVLVTAAAGGVGSILAQLALRKGATVLGTASRANREFLRAIGVIPVTYGESAVREARALAPGGITVVFDQWGEDAIVQALELGVAPERINTIAVHPAPFGARNVGRHGPDAAVLAELADLVAAGDLVVAIDSSYVFADFLAAFERAEGRHLRGKVVIDL